ncbi:prepilin-type N-terminal cleavage/methylation domain-containing protein [Elusimicrobium posterum]|uniref:pilin n=1 Tax=Elusimicrobium posterum TaxID=3116653 RepID=UPI003C71AEB0
MKKGFTLIELLVVVLIIGILAAIALPQYQKAVTKSRVAEMVLLARRVITEQDVHILGNGSSTTDMSDLLSECPSGNECIFKNKYRISMNQPAPQEYYFQVRVLDYDDRNMPFIEFNNSPWEPWGGFFCIGEKGTFQEQVCKTQGTLYNTNGNFNYFKIN